MQGRPGHRARLSSVQILNIYLVAYRIYNDVITLKSAGNYMVKLTISHAIAQSVKMTLFEGLIENTINATKNIPQTMAETGKVPMSRYGHLERSYRHHSSIVGAGSTNITIFCYRTAITKKIGQLFIMRINVNLVSNILDTPEIFWSEPSFQPLYSAIRGKAGIHFHGIHHSHGSGV